MGQSLVIVESPAKAKTIEKFLGKGYKVMASYGHVRALPSKQGSVDVDNDFEPQYQVLPESQKHIDKLRKEAQRSDEIILATDLDREGEAIAWHLIQALEIPEDSDKPQVKRVTFHEITEKAIQEAIAHPRGIAHSLVDAQQARSILDYLVGFNLSPFLWRKIRYGLSAGRVQSVALRLVCEREKEIQGFEPQEFWTLEAVFTTADGSGFSARLYALDGKKLDKFYLQNGTDAQTLRDALAQQAYSVSSLEQKQKRRNPAPPFTTSTLQQEASRKLGFSARKTMSLAQRLYEGVDTGQGAVGLITYMRTDSVALASEATQAAQDYIRQHFGPDYALKKPRAFKNKAKNAQEAHEAIRPTGVERTPEALRSCLDSDQFKLYQLIWQRMVASQMAAAVYDATTVDIATAEPLEQGSYSFRASGQILRFAGFLKLYQEGRDDSSDDKDSEQGDKELPPLQSGQQLAQQELKAEQHFTQPPPRYTEASLVKTLEEYGIGRPSTYASILNTLVQRQYVRLEKRTFYPEDIGMVVNDLLSKHFAPYVDYAFTARMEENLDAISRGETSWRPKLREFWEPFIQQLKTKDKEISKQDVTTEETDRTCPECGKPLVVKLGKAGKFLACSGFPDCRYTESLDKEKQQEPEHSEQTCDKCGAQMLIKTGRYGKFLACSAYPECKNIQPLVKPKPTGIACPACGEGELMEKKSRRGKIFYSCNRYPKCKYALWHRPLDKACPQCGHTFVAEKTTKKEGTVHYCPKEGCDWKETIIAPEKVRNSHTSGKGKGKGKKAAADNNGESQGQA